MMYKIVNSGNFVVRHLPILGHGNQGTVFKNGDHATKVFSLASTRPNDSDGRVAIKISYLNLNAFVKPYNLIFRDGKLYSFDMELLQLERNKKIIDMDIEDVIKSINLIRSDVKTLSEEGIMIRDLQTHNIGICKDFIRVFDFSDYLFSDDDNLLKLNNAEIDSLFGSFCLYEELPEVDSIKIYDYIYSDFLRSKFDSIEEYFSENILGKYKNIREFVMSRVGEKQLIKKR